MACVCVYDLKHYAIGGTVLLQCLIFAMGEGTAERVLPPTIHAACAIAQFDLRLIQQSQICHV